jgi:hypothetical protein
MGSRIQVVAIVAAMAMFVCVFELVRRKKLMERYALLWLFSATLLLALAVWKGLLIQVAETVGIYYAPSALFAVAFACVLALLLHFSLVISRLVDQNKVLAQRLSVLQERFEQLEARSQLEVGQAERAQSEAGATRRLSRLR